MCEPRNFSIFRFDLRRNDQLVITLAGNLGGSDARRLREAITTLAGGAERELVVDLAHVGCIDSACLAVLLWIRNHCRARARRLVLRSPSHAVIAALAASGLSRSFSYELSGSNEETEPADTVAALSAAPW
jgi:anti-anti-sigma factor